MQLDQALSGPKPAFSEPEVVERGEWGWVRRFMALCILNDVTLCNRKMLQRSLRTEISITIQSTQLRIDIVSDVMCPWCVIGYGLLAIALEATGVDHEIY